MLPLSPHDESLTLFSPLAHHVPPCVALPRAPHHARVPLSPPRLAPAVSPVSAERGGETGRRDRDRWPHPAPWLGPSLAADGRETPTHLAELGFAASLSSDPAPSASPTCICLNRCLPLALGHLNPLEAGSEGESEAVSPQVCRAESPGGGFQGCVSSCPLAVPGGALEGRGGHRAPCPSRGAQRAVPWPGQHTPAASPLARPPRCPALSPGLPQPRSSPSPQPPPSPGAQQGWAKPRGGSGLVEAQQFPPVRGQGGAGSSTQLDPGSPALRGPRGCVGSPGLLPAPLLVGGLWLPVWLSQPLALGEAFVSAALGCGVSSRRRGGLAGLGPLLPCSPPEPAVCPHSPARPWRMTACPSGAGRLPASPTAPPRTPSPSAPR